MTAAVSRPAPRAFDHVETWVFDLDNTLYPHHVNLWQQVDVRIRDYIADFLKISHDEAFRLQKDYYKRYGTSMRGLMTEHGMKPDDFLDFVHQVDHSPLEPNPALGAAIERAARPQAHPHQRHPQPCRRRAGAARARPTFRGRVRHRRRRARTEAFAADLRALPQRARRRRRQARRCSRTSRATSRCRTALGMTTVLVVPENTREVFREDWELEGRDEPHVDHVTDDLVAFLETVAAVG